MRKYRSTATPVAIPLKSLISGVSVALLLSVSASFIAIEKANPELSAFVRAGLTQAFLPVMQLAAAPVDTLKAADRWIDEMVGLRAQNERLRAENDRLLKWQAVARQFEAENKALSTLAQAVPPGATSYISSRIVAESRGPYVKSALINAGKEQGVAKDQAVIAADGMVGRVMDAGLTNSRILLLTDINSRIPVISEHSRERSIAAGDNSPQLNLLYVPEQSQLTVGERIVTSGDGGVMPAGLPVGIITAIDAQGVKVQPLADWTHLEYVSVVNFRL